MTHDTIVAAILRKARLSAHDEEWARAMIGMPLDEIRKLGGDLVDFSGCGCVLAVVIEAREALARAGLSG